MAKTQPELPPSEEGMIESYSRWIADARGITRATEADRIRHAKELLAFLGARGRTLASATPLDVDAYFAENSSRWCRLSLRTVTSWLKDFLSFAAQMHWCDRRLALSIVAPRIYPQEGLPYHAPWEKIVEMLRASAKDRTRQGRRAYAILMLLATYGVRSSEVVRLELGDIDWRKETIFFNRSKGGRSQSLPLVHAVGEAILRYIRHARHNESGSRNLFLRADAPYAAIGSSVVYATVRKALEGVGVESAHLGPHCIRHSFATHHVNGGCSLKEVSDMLGHRSLGSTAVYAKIDLASLREVAEMDWGAVL